MANLQKRGIPLKESDLQKAIVEYLDLMGFLTAALFGRGGKQAKIAGTLQAMKPSRCKRLVLVLRVK